MATPAAQTHAKPSDMLQLVGLAATDKLKHVGLAPPAAGSALPYCAVSATMHELGVTGWLKKF